MGWLFQTKSERQRDTATSGKRSISEYEGRSPATSNSTTDKPEGKHPINLDQVKDCLYEVFMIGGKPVDYFDLIDKFDTATLEALMASPSTTVEVHYCGRDNKDAGRVPAALEQAFYDFLHKQRVDLARQNKGYALPAIKLSARTDGDDTLSLDQMAEQLRQAGYTVTPAPAAPQSGAASDPPAPSGGVSAPQPAAAPAPTPRSSGPNPALAAGSQD